MSRSIYTKLTGRNRSLTGFTQLWQAPDHILLVNSSRFSEQYKRFSFFDIQSIVVSELPPRVIPQVIMILAAVAWMSLWFSVDSKFGKWAFLISGALGLLIPIIDIARGARCRCHLHTRVSKELLAPVSRTRIARKFLAAVRPSIESVQGVLPPPLGNEIPATSWEPPPPELVSAPSYLPEIVFGLFFVSALGIWSTVRLPKALELSGIPLYSTLAEILLIVVALVRRKGRDERVVPYIVLVLALALIVFDMTTVAKGIGGWYLTVIEKAKVQDSSITPMTIFTRANSGWFIACGWRVAAGAIGLASAFFERRGKWAQ
jgi:hypothetical protein